jgi:CRISPR/Cas system CSM-associated protein Csm3 (group 7 of RAMP superfamily)
MKYKLKIKLLSDMCCATGGGNGSYIDTFSSFDNEGYPIIPGKRMKGVLRECAELLVKGKKYTNDDISTLFGGDNGKNGLIRVSNATVTNRTSTGNTPAEVRDSFTSLRSRTKINKEGIAENHSLRTIQTVNKGTEFFAEIDVNSDNCGDMLSDCVKIMRHIGLNQTRGLGEIQCTLEEIKEASETLPDIYTSYGEYETYLYRITLLSAMATDGDYIAGTALQGSFAEKLKSKPYFEEIILKNTIFGNAYISDGEHEYFPMPKTYREVKNADVDKTLSDYKDKIFDTALQTPEGEQLVAVEGFMRTDGDKIYLKNAEHEIAYHHSRANEDSKANLFYFRKIPAGASFVGRISLDKNAVSIIKAAASIGMTFGKSRSAEYASCKFEILSKIEKAADSIVNQNCEITLLSDMILFDDLGNNTTDPKALIAEFGMKDDTNVFTEIITVGGYNAHRKLPNIRYNAFAKGTVISGIYNGEREGAKGLYQNTGYGRFCVSTNLKSEYNVEKEKDE